MSRLSDHDLARALGELPGEIEPRRDLWGGVSARIEAERRRRRVVRRSVTGATLLAAAAAVVLVMRSEPAKPVARAAHIGPDKAVAVPPAPAPLPIIAPAVVAPEEASYHAALTALSPSFEARKSELPEETRRAVEASLGALEAAVLTTRAALAEHPDDTDLRAELDGEYEQLLETMNDVLEWTTRS